MGIVPAFIRQKSKHLCRTSAEAVAAHGSLKPFHFCMGTLLGCKYSLDPRLKRVVCLLRGYVHFLRGSSISQRVAHFPRELCHLLREFV